MNNIKLSQETISIYKSLVNKALVTDSPASLRATIAAYNSNQMTSQYLIKDISDNVLCLLNRFHNDRYVIVRENKYHSDLEHYISPPIEELQDSLAKDANGKGVCSEDVFRELYEESLEELRGDGVHLQRVVSFKVNDTIALLTIKGRFIPAATVYFGPADKACTTIKVLNSITIEEDTLFNSDNT